MAMLVQENVELMHKVYNNNSSYSIDSSYNNNVHNDSHKTNKSGARKSTMARRKILRVNNVCRSSVDKNWHTLCLFRFFLLCLHFSQQFSRAIISGVVGVRARGPIKTGCRKLSNNDVK